MEYSERERERGRKGGREEGREGGRKREGEREGEREGGREGGRDRQRETETERSSFSTKDRSESSSNESIILDFCKLKPYDLQPVCESRMFSSESELDSEAEEQGRIGNAYWCQCGECKHMAVWLLIRKACVARTLMKFLKN